MISRIKSFIANIKRHLEIWRVSWEETKRETPLRRPQGKELAFLPAVIEVQETPPSPAGRITALVIITLFAAALLWATFGKIDIIAIAQGKIVPGDRSKVIQPLESGVIKAIHVRDGQRVKRGDPLIEIDTMALADRDRFANEYVAALTDIARLRALLTNQDDFAAPKGADPVFVKIQKGRLTDQLAEYRALQSQAEAYKQLAAKQYVPQIQYLDVEQKRAAKNQEYAGALSEAETRAHSLSKELSKAQTRSSQQYLTTSIDGVVQQLAVHTVGGVVTPAQQLMVIAPQEGHVEIEAWIENKDIGFVNEAQEAEIKIEAFPFTRYGTIPGRVLSLSKDAVPLEKAGFFYGARVSMEKAAIVVENNKQVLLTPGMNVSVEIKTGKRRVIEYFLSPLLQATSSSIKER